VRAHQRVFDYPLNTLSYPVCQNISVGFVRSALDRQKLFDWMSGMVEQSVRYGQAPYSSTGPSQKDSIAEDLRKIAFAPKA